MTEVIEGGSVWVIEKRKGLSNGRVGNRHYPESH